MTGRSVIVMAMAGAIALLALPPAIHPPPRLIWNASASVRTGLYAVHPARDLRAGDLVVVAPPEPLAGFLASRGTLPAGVLLIKPVAALPGQTLCRTGAAVSVEGAVLGEARAHDRLGRPLPAWQGCRLIAPDEVFLMNPARPDSFDGRYFGPLPASTIVGRASPLWTSKKP